MRIQRLELINFRNFEHTIFDLPERFTVLVGDNATGKTAILDAITISVSCLFCKVDKFKHLERQFSDDARDDLITRIGEYCSFSETPLGVSLAVEHILPKSLYPHLERDWDKFLLACTNCNSTKGNKNIVLADYYLPDRDNTFRAFIYLPGGIVRVDPNLEESEQEKALNTLKLTGLDRTPANDPAMKDRRWLNRQKAWDIAERSLKNLKKNDTPFMREQIVETANTRGFWSVWMTVFSEDTDMLKRLIHAFEGTC